MLTILQITIKKMPYNNNHEFKTTYMNYIKLPITILFVISVYTFSFSQTQVKSTTASSSLTNGKKVYMKHCFACHQMDGSGAPGLYPPLQKTDWVSGDKTRLIKLTLEGMQGSIIVNDEEYNKAMPTHKFLTDQQAADVLTYIRQNFGNKASAVTPAEVAKVRSTIKK
jgi:mono/diheme cytochrome c family protein